MGNSVALHASKRTDPLREPVVLLERSGLGSGSTSHSGAILRQHYGDQTIASMARDSLRYYAAFEGQTGRSLGFRRVGVLTIAGPSRPTTLERLREALARHRAIGIQTRELNAEEIRAKVPGIEVSDDAIASWEPGGGFVDPVACVSEFAGLARTYGASTRLGVAITGIEVEKGRIVGAETTEGHYETERLAIVAGSWCRPLLAKLGVELPLRVARVEQLFVGMPSDEDDMDKSLSDTNSWSVDLEDPLEQESERLAASDDMEPAPGSEHPVVLDLEYGVYTRCEPMRQRTRVCPIDYVSDDILDEPIEGVEPRADRLAHAREMLVKRMPFYADQPDKGSLVSFFPLVPDGRAVIGQVPGVEGLYVASGFADHGFKLAPSVGEGVAQMMLGEPVSAFEPEYFSPERLLAGIDEDWSGRRYL